MYNRYDYYRTSARKKQVPDSPGKRIIQTRRDMYFNFIGADTSTILGYALAMDAFVKAEIKHLERQKGRFAIKRETLRRQTKSLSLTSTTCRMATSETVSADTKDDDDGGGSEDPDPARPPRLVYIFSSHIIPILLHYKNKFLFSWQTAPGYCCMPGGGQR